MDGIDHVVSFIRDITWQDLPPEVQRKARLAFMDVLGAALSGTSTQVSQITAGFATKVFPGNESTLLLRGLRCSAIGAAFANGYAANALDTDDCAKFTRGHPGVQVFATALALCEKLHLGGRDLLTGMVVGYEVAHRMARIWHHSHEVYQACGSWGSVATAAVAAHLLRLDEVQVRQALGIAEYHAPNLPMMRDIDHPAMVKHGIGWGAMTGMMAAELAACGFTGTPSSLGLPDYHDWVADIGTQFIMVDGVTFKEYGSCAWSHPPIDVARALVREHAIHTEDIVHIRVEGFAETVRLGARLPASTEEAQFNTAWPLAAYLVYGQVGPEQTLEAHLDDERVVALAQKVELVESPELTRLAHLKWLGDPLGRYASAVEITLRDGHTLRGGSDLTGRTPVQDWSEQQIEDKFRWLVGSVLPKERVDPLVHTAWQIEDLARVGDLVGLIGTAQGAT